MKSVPRLLTKVLTCLLTRLLTRQLTRQLTRLPAWLPARLLARLAPALLGAGVAWSAAAMPIAVPAPGAPAGLLASPSAGVALTLDGHAAPFPLQLAAYLPASAPTYAGLTGASPCCQSGLAADTGDDPATPPADDAGQQPPPLPADAMATPVPEPERYAMLALGVFLLLFCSRAPAIASPWRAIKVQQST